MLTKAQQLMFDSHKNQYPDKYTVPEPPRGNSIRVKGKYSTPPFTVIGDAVDWRSFAKVLNGDLNYWEKTPISDEVLVTRWGTWNCLVRPEDVKYFSALDDIVDCGVCLFEEDVLDGTRISAARDRCLLILPELKKAYEDKLILDLANVPSIKPKNKGGRPKGSKNKKKVKV